MVAGHRVSDLYVEIVDALLYSGKPASRTPGRNITLDQASTALPFGAGVSGR
jgi:hypothetical protein